MSALDDLVLKLTTYMPGGMEWKPELHPRDHSGKFKPKFGGVFNALNSLKAGKYGAPVVYKGQAGYHAGLDNSVPEIPAGDKLGGVEIHAPTEHGYAPSVHHIDWHLAPGEKVYAAHGGPTFSPNTGSTGAIIHHADGSATALLPTPEGEMPKVGATNSNFSEMYNSLTSIGYTIDTAHPLDFNDELEAQKVQQEMAAVDHAKEIGAAPDSAYGKKPEGAPNETTPEPSAPKPTYQEGHVGPGGNKIVHMLQDDAGNHVGHVEQLDNGKYTSHNAKGEKVGNITKHLPTAVEKVKSGKLTTPSTYQHKKPAKAAAKEAEKTKPEPKAEISPEKKVAEEAPKPEPKQLTKEVLHKQDSGAMVGHIQEHEDGTYSAHDAAGNKISEGHTSGVAKIAVFKAHHTKVKAEKDAADAKVQAELKAKADAEAEKMKAKADAEAEKPSEPAHLEGKKVFQHIHDEQGNHLGHIEQTPEGKYTSHDAAGNKVGNITKHLPTAIEKVKSGKLTTPEKKATSDVTPVEAKVKDVSATEKHLTGEDGQYIGKLVKDDTTGKWQSYDAHGEKLGYTISNVQTAIDKVKVAAAKNPPKAAEPKKEEPKPEPKVEAKKIPVNGVDGELGHVTQGNNNGVKAVYKDGTVLGDFKSAGLAANAIKKHHITTVVAAAEKEKVDSLQKSNEELAKHVEPTEVDTVVGKVPLLPGQAAYLSKGSPWAAVVQDGKVLYIYNPSTGETKDHTTKDSKFGYNYVEGWQKSLDEGKLVKADENGPENAPSTPEAAKEVHQASVPGPDDFVHANFGSHGQHSVVLQPGEKLYTHKTNPEYGAWVAKTNGTQDGYDELGKLVAPDTKGSEANLVDANWHVTGKGPEIVKDQPSSDAPLAEIYKNSLSGVEYHFDANGIATKVQTNGSKVVENAAFSNAVKANLKTLVAEPNSGWTKVELNVPETHKPPAGATPEPVKKAAAKKKAVKASDLPHEFDFGGKTHKLKPGSSLWTKEVDGDTKLYSISGVSGKGTIYNSDTTINYWLGGDKKVSLASLKKNGWTQVAAGEAKQEISGPDATVALDQVPNDYSGGKNVYSYADNIFSTLSGWGSALWKTNDATDAEWTKSVAQYHANLTYIKAHPDEFNLDKSDKMKVTKALNYADALWKLHVVATKIDDPNWEPNAQDKATLADVKAHFEKLNVHSANSTAQALEKKVKAADFQASLKDLNFDLNHGSPEEFTNYAQQQGAPFLGGMDDAMVQDWVNLHLGTPGYYPESGLTSKSSIEAKASQLLKMKAVAAHATAAAEKKAAMQPQPTKEEKLVQKAVTKQYESFYKKASKLKDYYEHSDNPDYYANYKPVDGTFHVYGPIEPGIITSADYTPAQMVKFLEDHPEWKSAGEAKSLNNYAEMTAKYVQQSEGLDDEQLKEIPEWLPSSLGAQGGDYMSPALRNRWFVAHLTGDQIGKYNIEKAALDGANMDGASILSNHPGSPNTPDGKIAHQSLANHLNTLPYWTSKEDPWDFNAWNNEDLSAFVQEFGLHDAYQAKGNEDKSFKYMVSRWLVDHENLPKPENTASVDVGKMTTKDGVEFTVPHGSLVSYDGTSHTVFSPDGFYVVKKDGTETQHWKYSGNKDVANAVAAHAFTLTTGEQDATPKWDTQHILDFFLNNIDTKPVVTQKPSGMSQTSWDFVNGAEVAGKDLVDFIGSDIAKMDDEAINTAIHNHNGFTKEQKLKILAASPAIRKLAAWAANNKYGDNSTVAQEVSAAIGHKADAGDYITPETETWVQPNSGKSLPIPPGATVYDLKNEFGPGYYAVVVDNNVGYKIMPSGSVMSYPYITIAKQQPEVFTSKANLSHDKAVSEGESFTQAAFAKIAAAEEQKTWMGHSNESLAPFQFQQAAKKIDGGEKYLPLTTYLHTLPVGVKQLATEAALNKDTDTLDALLWKQAKGAYAIAPEVHTTPVVDPSASYAQYIAEGKIGDGSTIYNSWQAEHIDDFIKDHSVSVESYADYYDKAYAVSQFLPSLIPPTVTTEDKIAKGVSDFQNLDLVKTDKSYGGMHTKQGWTDQYGQEWMSKGFNSDPFGPLRVDVEHESLLIGKIFGFRAATSFTKEVGGKYSVIQKIEDNIGDLKGFQPKDLNNKQLIGAMQEHVLDWLIANHDTHEENLLRLPDGESILGIDKGQAFKHLGKDKLAVGYLPPENGAPVWYDRFYNGITNGSVDKETADKVAYSVLAKAYAVQSRNDTLYRQHLESAFANRPEGSWPSHLNTKEKFIDYAMERKANLLNDFSALYQDLYKKAGYDWTIDTEAFGKNVGGAHIANSPVYAQEVKDASAFGKALMFSTTDLEDAHIMHNTMEQMNGGTALLGYGKVRQDADKALTDWLKNRVEGKLSHGQQAYVPEVAKPDSYLENIPELHTAIVSYSKTLAQHASNGGKEPDGQYNQNTIANATTIAATVAHHLAQLKTFRANNPDKLYQGLNLTTLEQQDAWVAAAEQKLSEFKIVTQAHEANTPVKNIFPDAVPFEPISYTPSKGLAHHDESKPVEKYVLDSGEHAVKTSDGGHYLLDASGGKTWVSSQDYGNYAEKGKQVPLDASKAPQWVSKDGTVAFTKDADGKWKVAGSASGYDDNQMNALISASAPGDWVFHGPEEQPEQSQTVQISGKTFKVTHRSAALHGGVIDPKTGKLIEKSKQSKALQNGYEYTIEHGKVKIHYRPWTEPGVLKAQQGVLHYEVRDWDGGHEAINDVLDTLRIAGLDLTPADAESLEHHYWNHLTNVIQDRADRNDKKHKDLIDAVKKDRLANPNMTTGESLDSLKKAWSKAYGNSAVENAAWQPQFGKHFGQEDVGRPYWMRPDAGVAELKAIYGTKLPIHQIQANGYEDAENRTHSVLMGGGLMATEERPRVLGSAVEGMSSGADQGHGSSGFVFTRQNMSHTSQGSDGGPMMVIDPLAALRTTNYAFDDDKYGEIDDRKTYANFDPKKMYGISVGGNEMMIKHEAPIFVAVFGTQDGAQKEIQRLHAEGVTEINGRKIEDVVLWQDLWNNTYKERIDKLWKDLLEAEKKFTEGGA